MSVAKRQVSRRCYQVGTAKGPITFTCGRWEIPKAVSAGKFAAKRLGNTHNRVALNAQEVAVIKKVLTTDVQHTQVYKQSGSIVLIRITTTK